MLSWVVVSWALLAVARADVCPDGGRCEEGHTCCTSPAEGYECCPFDQAECCEDHVHCCPAHTLCNLPASSCENSTVSLRWTERTPAGKAAASKSFRMIRSYAGEDEDNICPDQSRCPAEFSCLKALTKYGCCPLPQGVPCSDGKHCCPEGHLCSLDSRTCMKKELMTTVLCSDGVSECPDESTCCETPDGTWGCCPMPKAVCCEDKKSCCPEGTTCDVQHMKCISSSSRKELPMWAKFPARIRADWENQNLKDRDNVTAEPAADTGTTAAPEVPTANSVAPSEAASSVTRQAGEDVPCDASVSCPDGTTCCENTSGEWACCLFPEAVCCEDHEHCCPKGTKCNLAQQTCDGDSSSEPWSKKMPSMSRKVELQEKNVSCDGTTSCPDGTTCCKTKDGGWACCPFPEAVCCEDHEHCCPKGTKCNLAQQTCDGDSSSEPWSKKMPSMSRKVELQEKNVSCDGTTSCPDGTTCCKTKDGGWACCPFPEAVCCEDHEHCCPKGTKCNLAQQTCDGDSSSEPWSKKMPSMSRKVELQEKNVSCDGTTSCPDGTTCCKTKDGGWACCPFPEAVCCEDHEHCCPKGTKCNLAQQTCDGDSSSEPWSKKMPSMSRKVELQEKNVSCDGTTSCPDGTTCCKTKDGGWACCPFPEAVCCEDHEHCCPKGTKCNLAQQTCDGDSSSEPWSKKMPSMSRKVELQEKNVSCDGTTSCPDGTTCCKTKDGGWACCPFPEAVCCEDHEHCCPKGTKCNLAQQTCDGDSSSEPWSKKMPSMSRKVELQEKNVSCDGTTSCPDGTTCCKTKDGGWACCPLPEAVCCEDHEHCCPAGTTCDLATLTCQQRSGSTGMKQKIPAFPTLSPTATQSLPTSTAPTSTAETSTAETSTAPTSTAPTSTAPTSTAETSTAAPSEEELDGGGVKCDAQTSCPQLTTCCMMSTRKWGCCPLPQAVCCADGGHCCPAHYRCDESRTACIKEDLVIPWYTKIPALTSVQDRPVQDRPVPVQDRPVQDRPVQDRPVPVQDRPVQDRPVQDRPVQDRCPEHTSCCQLRTGEQGCCPLDQAVCCPDLEHCCPGGYTCDVASRSCHRLIQLQLETVPLTPVYQVASPPQDQQPPPVSNDLQCDDQFRCRDDETCCRTSSSTWGCCPSPHAICCSDMKALLSSGYSCTEGGSCLQTSRLHWNNWNFSITNKNRTLIV